MPSEATVVALGSLLRASMVPQQRVEGTLEHFLAYLVLAAIPAAAIKHPGRTRAAILSVACLEMVLDVAQMQMPCGTNDDAYGSANGYRFRRFC